ncbi:hypothetical protein [Ruminococcus albus]|uniref:Uncharacterized protein n=1 Tax=Ruminococcus albus (strain ATCC 27210 / DSM 20455 / JCM 14654 / NCDO 2250 / 7) TaxID=697329 RepID=E6UFG4_RUMA7|nr:hypothetical protein [Ruminococcus albus]ADU21868.1 hypothetical protein Rumal_1354 [Ruminococcus albus 7 = DSM 20455]
MAVSEAHQKADIKCGKENLTNLAVRLRKEKAAKFKELAYKNNTTPNALFKEFVDKYIEENSWHTVFNTV